MVCGAVSEAVAVPSVEPEAVHLLALRAIRIPATALGVLPRLAVAFAVVLKMRLLPFRAPQLPGQGQSAAPTHSFCHSMALYLT